MQGKQCFWGTCGSLFWWTNPIRNLPIQIDFHFGFYNILELPGRTGWGIVIEPSKVNHHRTRKVIQVTWATWSYMYEWLWSDICGNAWSNWCGESNSHHLHYYDPAINYLFKLMVHGLCQLIKYHGHHFCHTLFIFNHDEFAIPPWLWNIKITFRLHTFWFS